MIEMNCPTQETVMERNGSPVRRRPLFDMIESPEPGWETRRIHRRTAADAPPVWAVELIHEADGMTVEFEHETLFVAWARATEQAHMMKMERN